MDKQSLQFDFTRPDFNLAVFRKFLNIQRNQFASFDLGVLVLSANYSDFEYPVMDFEGADKSCQSKNGPKKIPRVAILGLSFEHPAIQLAKIVAN